jgi:peptidyl-prolyl cis-trans isomerase D
VEKVNDAKTLSFSEAKEEIRKTLSDERAKNLAYEEAAAFYDELIAGAAFEKAAENLEFDLLTTGFFTRNAPPADVADPDAFAVGAFDLQSGEISDIQEMKDVYYILQVLEKKPPETPEFETVSERVRKDWVREKRREKARSDAETFLAVVKSGTSFTEASRRRKKTVATTGFFKRNAPIPEIGRVPEVTQAAFDLTPDQPIAPAPIQGETGYYVVALVEKKIIPPADAAAERKKARELIETRKQTLAFNTLISQLKSNADIFLEEGFSDQ